MYQTDIQINVINTNILMVISVRLYHKLYHKLDIIISRISNSKITSHGNRTENLMSRSC